MTGASRTVTRPEKDCFVHAFLSGFHFHLPFFWNDCGMVMSCVMKMAKKTWVLFSFLGGCKALSFIFKIAKVVAKKIQLLRSFYHVFRNPPMFSLDLQDELLCQEVIVVQPYMYEPSTRERCNVWSRIADRLNSIGTQRFLCQSKVSTKTIKFNFYAIQNKDLSWSQSHRHRGKRTNTNQKFIERTW